MDYRNIRASSSDLEEMLERSGGRQNVPVIIEGGMVVVGYGGT